MRVATRAVVITLAGGWALMGAAGAGCSSGSSAAPNDAGTSSDGSDGSDGGGVVIARPWDWAGVIGTGQSLAVGQMGLPPATTTQPFNNLQLSTGTLPWPIDPDDASLMMVPLIEPIGRPSTAYPSSWPTNIAGETPHASMANQITALVQAADGGDYVGVHGEVGENGQCIVYPAQERRCRSGVNGHAYQATLIETQAITRLAGAMGKTYGVGAIIVTHGECDAGNARPTRATFTSSGPTTRPTSPPSPGRRRRSR